MTTLNAPVRKAVIPAAGLGTRFLPATKAMPKEMLPVVDKPAIQYVVEEAVNVGLNDILMITGRNKRALEDHFDRVPALEATLEAKGDTAKLESIQAASNLATSTTCARATPWAWATPCSAPSSTWSTNLSLSCWAMT